ncbi:MAG: hypothetical protein LBG80_15565 [Bacteroidales bacterium]|jgi:hypothetical protein|nr:hypothetical protein [Bacteroidales bacterium]
MKYYPITPKDIAIRGLKHAYRKITGIHFQNPECNCDRQESNDIVYDILAKGEPCMISRFGTTEINCINNYLTVHNKESRIKKIWQYISDNTHTPWWNTQHFRTMSIYSGIFPPSQETAERFAERYLDDIPLIDVLASYVYYEKFMPLRPDVKKVQLEMLYPFFVERPWTRILHGRKVLVIHPFEKTIQQQYAKRKLLFDSPDILPDFELLTMKAVQSITGKTTPFKDWFEALAYMEKQILGIDFDVCILGCGAYGMPLAAYIKRLGKQAIHVAGGTQLLFGILGKRWTEQYPGLNPWRYSNCDINIDYRPVFNQHWVFPSETEKPENAKKVEDACYW